jgi:GAF domain-containing protein
VSDPSQWDRRSIDLADRFLVLADTLVDDFDAVDLMNRLVASSLDLLGVQAAGLLLRDSGGNLELVASSSEESRLLELYQLQQEQGPCLDSVSTGLPVVVDDLSAMRARWPDFSHAAGSLGFLSAYSFPLRLREHTVGGLNLFCASPALLDRTDRRLAQALADMATIGLLQHEARHRSTRAAEQLQAALDSRIVIEQAKGVLAEYARIGMDDAFEAIRHHARDHNRRLAEVATSVVRRTLPLDSVLARRRRE